MLIEQLELPFEDRPGEEATAKKLPKPAGYQILVALVQVEDKFDSGIVKADQTKKDEEIYSPVGFVLALGPDAYQDKAKFPSGPWCKEGDFIVMGALRGTRVKIHEKEFRFINDDTVLGTCDDPRGYSRA